MKRNNPFYQHKKRWSMSATVPHYMVDAVESVFEDETLSSSSFQIDEKQGTWKVSLVLGTLLPEAEVSARFDRINHAFSTRITPPTIEPLENRDWVSEVQASFPALFIGNFAITGSHHQDIFVKEGLTRIQLDAGAAFGTGEHATTSGCLLAIDWVMKRYAHRITSALDMGCGSGILAMAVAKRYHVSTIAVDIDPVSVKVAKENIAFNQLKSFIQADLSNGYQSKLVQNNAPYDLVIANILAKPLMKFSPDIYKTTHTGSIIILSGLLSSQENMVRIAHHRQGFRLKKRLLIDGWSTLVMAR